MVAVVPERFSGYYSDTNKTGRHTSSPSRSATPSTPVLYYSFQGRAFKKKTDLDQVLTTARQHQDLDGRTVPQD